MCQYLFDNLTLRLRNTHIRLSPDFLSFRHFLVSSSYFQTLSNFIKFYTKFQVKQAKFLLPKCIVAASQQTSTAQLPLFLQKFQNTVRSLRVKKSKLTLRNVFILDLFALGGEKELKYDKRTLFWGFSAETLTCLLTRSLRNTHIRVFPDFFSYRHFLVSSSYFQTLRVTSLNSALNSR